MLFPDSIAQRKTLVRHQEIEVVSIYYLFSGFVNPLVTKKSVCVVPGWIALFTLPKAYEMNKAQVDANLELARAKIDEISAK